MRSSARPAEGDGSRLRQPRRAPPAPTRRAPRRARCRIRRWPERPCCSASALARHAAAAPHRTRRWPCSPAGPRLQSPAPLAACARRRRPHRRHRQRRGVCGRRPRGGSPPSGAPRRVARQPRQAPLERRGRRSRTALARPARHRTLPPHRWPARRGPASTGWRSLRRASVQAPRTRRGWAAGVGPALEADCQSTPATSPDRSWQLS